MASGGNSDTTIYAGPIPRASQKFVSGAFGNSASIKQVNERFARENVRNYNMKEQNMQVPQFRDRALNALAGKTGDTMIQVGKGMLLEKKDRNHSTGFQEELKLAFEVLLKQCLSGVDMNGIDAEVRQGANTSTDIANVTKFAVSSQIDISVVLKKGDRAAVCGVCEVKRQEKYDEHSKYEQYIASITKQRSTQKVENGGWLLIGLVLTEKCAFITQLRTGTWWGYLAEVDSVERYEFGAAKRLDLGFQMLAVIREYLRRLFANFSDEQLFCDEHKLAYFTYPDLPDIVRSTASHIIKCRFETVRQYLAEAPAAAWKNECGKEDEVIVKVVSNAVYNTSQSGLSNLLHRLASIKDKYESAVAKYESALKDEQLAVAKYESAVAKYELALKDEQLAQLRERLRRMELGENAPAGSATSSGDTKPKMQAEQAVQAEQPTKPSDYVYSLQANHVWIGSCRDNSNAKVCVTRWLGNRVCRSPDLLSKWTAKETRQAFFDQVCTSAFGVIQHGYYHGDIRLPNIVVQVRDDTFQFSLIDWDELCPIETDRGLKTDCRYPIQPNQTLWNSNASQWAELFTACQLYTCAIIFTMVADASDAEAKAYTLESKWQDETQFWERSCPKNPIHAADEHGTNGLAELRKLMRQQPDKHLSANLNRLLKQVLNIFE